MLGSNTITGLPSASVLDTNYADERGQQGVLAVLPQVACQIELLRFKKPVKYFLLEILDRGVSSYKLSINIDHERFLIDE